MRKFVLAVFCLVGLLGCMNDNSTIDESSIVITRGNIRNVYVEAYVDANAKGLEGIDHSPTTMVERRQSRQLQTYPPPENNQSYLIDLREKV